MIIGNVELNRGQLLERIVTPVLVEVKEREADFLICLYAYGEKAVAVLVVLYAVEGLAAVALEVLTYLNVDRNKCVRIVKDCTRLKAAVITP